MSRPPRFRTRYTTTGDPLPGRAALDYLPDELPDFVERQRGLAADELGFPTTTAEGDFAGALMEMSALVAHVLGVYQDQFANESFLGTAQSRKSLVRHGRRLGYEPSPGLSATGHVVFSVKAGLSGTVPAGLALGSAPLGEKKAQDYETLADARVDAAWNEMLPAQAAAPAVLAGATSFQVAGSDLGLEVGDVVVVQLGVVTGANFLTIAVSLSAHQIAAVQPDDQAGTTTLTVIQALPVPGPGASFSGAVLHGRPRSRLHLFAWDSAATSFTDAQLKLGAYPGDPAAASAHGTTTAGYTASTAYSDADLYLSEELKTPVLATPVVRIDLDKGGLSVFKIKAEASRNATFKRVEHVLVKDADDNVLLNTNATVSVSKTVTAIQIQKNDGVAEGRTVQNIRTGQWLLDWEIAVPLITTRPNPQPVDLPMALAGAISGLVPGQLVALSTLSGVSPAVAEIARLTVIKSVAGGTQISWELIDAAPAATWQLGTLRILGNVAPISHGKTTSEVLGDSDGVTPFQRFALKQKPLTQLPGPSGAEPALAVTVADILFERVADFEKSGPNDRHYLVQRDDGGTTHVLFGDGKKGAIPVSGKKHVAATYRVGVGDDGNAAALAVSRIKKPHALLDAAANLRPVIGGAAAAELEDVRTQATGFIKTFDRAVSVEDHKHLALLYPGIVKANAVWTAFDGGAEGVRVVLADAAGNAPALESIRSYLRQRRDDTVPLDVVGAEPVELVASLKIRFDPAFQKELVEQEVRDALTATSGAAAGLFTFQGRDLGQPAFLSEVYERLERVPGVTFLQVSGLGLLTDPPSLPLLDTVIVQPHEWLNLQSQNLEITPSTAGEVQP